MPLPDIQRKQVEEMVGKFCEERIPPQFRNEIKVSYKIREHSVSIFENRASLTHEGEWVEIPVAQIRYGAQDSTWTLYCTDRNGRWHEYTDLKPERNLIRLILEIKEDPTGIFWG